jgi:(p)ppGpp synthase/HD superfamily hydrolase
MTDALVQVLTAAETAARWHAGQKRKGSAGEPYVNHLLEVARLVADATNGEDPALVIAALLHDAIEDQNISLVTIAERFGDDVAALVQEVTDDKSLESSERKRRQVEEAPRKSARAKILKLADKVSNVTAIGDDPPAGWPVQRQREYVQWGRDVVAGLKGVSRELEGKFDAVAAEAERKIARR